MNTHTSIKSKINSAFSLVELLVVIAVIAVIAAIAIPNIAGITQSADAATKLRNAQEVASAYNNYAETYFAASNSYPTNTTVAEAIAALGTSPGVSVANTRLGTTNTFFLPGVSTNNTATDKLAFTNNRVIYTP
jgi:prepilin-type N-terminal cleavage/methylation domain-containing protein